MTARWGADPALWEDKDVMRRVVAVGWLTAWFGVTGTAGDRSRPTPFEAEFNEVTRQVVTPHTPWARPYARARLRVLCVAPRPAHRDTVELAQRLDMDYCAIGLYMRNRYGSNRGSRAENVVGLRPDEVTRRFEEALREHYDVIIVGNIEWRLLPMRIEYEILRFLTAGGGLVLTGHTGSRDEHLKTALRHSKVVKTPLCVTEGIPFTAMPAWRQYKSDADAGARLVACYTCRAGRLAILNIGTPRNTYLVPGTWSMPEAAAWHVDYYMALAVRAVLWAARREPTWTWGALRVEQQGKPVQNVPAAQTKACRLRVRLNAPADAPGTPTVAIQVRDERGRVVWRHDHGLKRTGATVDAALHLPGLPAGPYIADVRVLLGGKAVQWASRAFRVVGQPVIRLFAPDQPVAHPGKPVGLTVELSRALRTPGWLRVGAVDSNGREFARSAVRVGTSSTKCRLSLPMADPRSNYMRVEAELGQGRRVLHRASFEMPVRRVLPRDDFHFLVWGMPGNDYVRQHVRRILYDLGVDLCDTPCTDPVIPLVNARAGLRVVPYATRYASRRTQGDPPARVPCLTDPAYRAAERAKLIKTARLCAPFGCDAYTLGDENFLVTGTTDVCFSPTCLADFRQWLKKRYGGLDALNRQWGTAHKSWADVRPIPLDEAQKTGRLSQWADHRMHMEHVFTEIHRLGREALRSVDPTVRAGFDGGFGTTSYAGYDWWALSRVMDTWNVYPNPVQVELNRSFHLPGALTGIWYGGYLHSQRYEAYERWMPWFSLLHGQTAAWWFKIFSTVTETCQEDGVGADLRVFPILRWTAEEIARIKQGTGKLLLGASRDHHGIAILYSQASLHASTIDAAFGSHPQAQRAAVELVQELGRQFDFISYQQLAGGALGKRGYRLLILPNCQALSPIEKGAVKTFVHAGGTVLADVRPGVRDQHGAWKQDAAWQDLWGVRWSPGGGKPRVARGTAVFQPRDLSVPDAQADGALAATTAKAHGALGKAPALLIHQHGAGRTVLVNVALAPFAARTPARDTLRQALASVVSTAVERPWYSATVSPGHVIEGEMVGYRVGQARAIAILREPNPDIPSQTVRMRLTTPWHVHDALTGKALGRQTQFEAGLGPGGIALFTLLPQPVGRLSIVAPAKVSQGARVRVEVRLALPSKLVYPGVVHVGVIDPAGRPVRAYAQNVRLHKGRAVVHVPFPWNGPTGAWTLRCRDAGTGMSAKATIEVTQAVPGPVGL